MDYKNWLEFECAIMDRLDAEKIEDDEDLQNLSEEFHNHLEIAFEDWATDKGFEYDRMY